ncbi:hypothetical protein Hanom_Chr00s000001g01595051 [Helianthus anomalus]
MLLGSVVKAHLGPCLGPLIRPSKALSPCFKSPTFRPSGAFFRQGSDEIPTKNCQNRFEQA